MKSFALAALVGVVCAASELESSFLMYITKFNKSYNSMEEYGLRLAEFTKKDSLIKAHNAVETDFFLAHNQFSTWTDAEYKAILTYKPQGNDAVAEEIVGTNEPINWIDIGCVNQVQDQGQCGSCWAFSSVASMEAANCIANNRLQKFSEQQLVDCDFYCYGCSGGSAMGGFSYFQFYYAMTESSYPYKARDGNCSYNSSNNTGVKTLNSQSVVPNSADYMKSALNTKVLSVAIEADQYVFQMYSSGVFSSTECGTSLDHATNVVGWGTDASAGDYWIMRNSWGTSWGIQGYMKVAIVDGKGICGIQMEPNWVITN